MTPADSALRRHIRALLTEAQAHVTLEDVLDGFPLGRINERVHGLPYSAYEVLWHLRFAQRDILEFSQPTPYREVNWPEGYWPHNHQAAGPQENGPQTIGADWHAQIAAFQADMDALLRLLDDPQTDLFATVPNGKDQTYLREFLLVADHNAYHVGQLALLRRLLSTGH